MKPRWRWTLWSVFAIAWTVALTRPVPDLQGIVSDGLLAYRIQFAKTLHVVAYGIFAILTAWLRAPMRWRSALMFLLMVHATATEHIQEHVPGRTGHLHDVGFDHLGILLGCLVSLRWWLTESEAIPDE